MRAVGGVAVQVVGVEHRANGVSRTFVDACKDRANARNVSAVIFDRLNSRLRGVARGDRRR